MSAIRSRGATSKNQSRDERLSANVGYRVEACDRRKDGSMFWAAIFISPVLDESGDVVQHFASFVDLTKQKREQAQSTMMINELNHRVKNTLATVQSIVWQALRNAEPVAQICTGR
jgi:two-component sensor histidine kinase